MTIHRKQFFRDSAAAKVDLNKRLEDSGWGFFLLMIGTLLMLPDEFVPRGAWLIGAGLIMLGLNCIRYLNDLSVSQFTVVLGFVAVIVGLAGLFGLQPPLLAIFLALVRSSIIVRSLIPRKVRPNNHRLSHG